MVLRIKRIFIPILIIVFMQILSLLYAGYSNRTTSAQSVQIKLKPVNLVVGNQIVLGEICEIYMQDTESKKRFSNINVGLAPPPGESIEITLIAVKKKITAAGYSNFIPYVTGPKIIRVETAHREIDKAFLQEKFAQMKIMANVMGEKV